MKPGDLVINRHTNKRLTVKTVTGGSGFVLCAWMEKDAKGEPIECTGAVDWKDLREPTEEERANQPAAPAEATPPEVTEEEPAEPAHEPQKRKGK